MPGRHWIEDHAEFGHAAGCGYCEFAGISQPDLFGTTLYEADAALIGHLREHRYPPPGWHDGLLALMRSGALGRSGTAPTEVDPR